MMLYVNPNKAKDRRVEAFGHGGSDGTYAVAFPERDLMVLYFSQSRGQQTILTFERALDALIINPDPGRAAALTAKIAPEKLRPYLGLFRAKGQDLYRAILVHEGKLAVEIPGNQVFTLDPTGEKDCWTVSLVPDQKLVFERTEEGAITGLRASGPMENAFHAKLDPSGDLPSTDELMKRTLAAHGTKKLEKLGIFRLSGTITMEARNMKGKICDLYQGRWRRKMITTMEGSGKQRIAIEGEKVSLARPMQEPVELSGIQAEQARLGSLGALLADWREDYREVQVLYRLNVFSEETFVVRTVPHIGFASTKYVGVKSGLLRAEDRITMLPGLGPMGALVIFEDYRDVEGVKIPFKWRSKAVHPLIGTIITCYEKVETHLDLPDNAFDIETSE